MPRATLAAVTRKAAKDRRFFRALLRDPEAALTRAGLQLAPGDLRRLKAAIRRKTVRLEIPLRALSRFPGSPADWQWRGAWPWRP